MAVDTIADALEKAITIKEQIRTAIISKEVDVPENTPFADYPAKVNAIKGVLQTKNITPTAEGGTVMPDTGYDGFSEVTLPAEANLTPANISKGVSIFGVTGTADTATFDIEQFFARTLKSLSLGVAEISNYAFYENTGLQSFTDTALASLGKYAFYNCTGLSSFIASALLTDLKEYTFYGCQALATFDLSNIAKIGNYTLYNCRAVSDIGTLHASEIGQYGAYYLASNAASGFVYDPDAPAVIGNYGLQYAKITEITGEIKTVGDYGLANLPSVFTKFSGKFSGAIGQYGFSNNQYLKIVDFSDSTISTLGAYAFNYLGWNRANYSTDPYLELDFRNSKFSTIDRYSLGYIRYANIHVPSAVSTINANAFYGCQNINIYMQGAAPTLASTSAFNNASKYKIYAPWANVASYTTGTNWASLASNIIGYAPAGTFVAGDTLPEYNSEGYAVTWYSDEAKTTQVTTCPADSPMLYCVPGTSKVKQVITIVNSGPIVLTVTDGSGATVDTSYGFILCGNGDTYNISATTSETGYTYYIKVDGVKVTAFPYSLTVGSSDIVINGTAYDPTAVNPDFAEATWRELKTAVETGVATTLYASDVGKTKEVTLKNGQTVHLRLSNNTADLYELADGTGTTGFAFEFVEQLSNTYYMNPSSTNTGGWDASYMRKTVMPIVFALLPDEVQEVIATVKRKSCYSGNDGTLVESEDGLFLLADPEVFGNNGLARPEEKAANTRWQYYANNDTAAARIKQRDGSNQIWWLCSPYNGYSNYFCFVSVNGNAGNYYAYTSRGVAPGFCL